MIYIIVRLDESGAKCNSTDNMERAARFKLFKALFTDYGSVKELVFHAVFKTVAWRLRGVMDVFDSHTLPPKNSFKLKAKIHHRDAECAEETNFKIFDTDESDKSGFARIKP